MDCVTVYAKKIVKLILNIFVTALSFLGIFLIHLSLSSKYLWERAIKFKDGFCPQKGKKRRLSPISDLSKTNTDISEEHEASSNTCLNALKEGAIRDTENMPGDDPNQKPSDKIIDGESASIDNSSNENIEPIYITLEPVKYIERYEEDNISQVNLAIAATPVEPEVLRCQSSSHLRERYKMLQQNL